jgi:hypothetical protein
MNNGDTVTRRIINSSYNAGTDLIELEFATPMDRNIYLDNHYHIGRFLLVKFNSSTFSLRYESERLFTIKFRFDELVKEYPV